MVAEHYESNKLHDAFDAFNHNADLVGAKDYESNESNDAFHSNARLVVAEQKESSKSTLLFILMLI